MGVDRWPAEPGPTVLGVVVHGPAVIARSPGIAIAVRCVLASPDGLEFDLVLRALGVQAEAAIRQTFGAHVHHLRPADGAEPMWGGGSEPRLLIGIDGRHAVADPFEQSNSGGDDAFTSELKIATGWLPSDGLVRLVASWPQAGLAEAAVTLTLASLDDLEDRVVRLPA